MATSLMDTDALEAYLAYQRYPGVFGKTTEKQLQEAVTQILKTRHNAVTRQALHDQVVHDLGQANATAFLSKVAACPQSQASQTTRPQSRMEEKLARCLEQQPKATKSSFLENVLAMDDRLCKMRDSWNEGWMKAPGLGMHPRFSKAWQRFLSCLGSIRTIHDAIETEVQHLLFLEDRLHEDETRLETKQQQFIAEYGQAAWEKLQGSRLHDVPRSASLVRGILEDNRAIQRTEATFGYQDVTWKTQFIAKWSLEAMMECLQSNVTLLQAGMHHLKTSLSALKSVAATIEYDSESLLIVRDHVTRCLVVYYKGATPMKEQVPDTIPWTEDLRVWEFQKDRHFALLYDGSRKNFYIWFHVIKTLSEVDFPMTMDNEDVSCVHRDPRSRRSFFMGFTDGDVLHVYITDEHVVKSKLWHASSPKAAVQRIDILSTRCDDDPSSPLLKVTWANHETQTFLHREFLDLRMFKAPHLLQFRNRLPTCQDIIQRNDPVPLPKDADAQHVIHEVLLWTFAKHRFVYNATLQEFQRQTFASEIEARLPRMHCKQLGTSSLPCEGMPMYHVIQDTRDDLGVVLLPPRTVVVARSVFGARGTKWKKNLPLNETLLAVRPREKDPHSFSIVARHKDGRGVLYYLHIPPQVTQCFMSDLDEIVLKPVLTCFRNPVLSGTTESVIEIVGDDINDIRPPRIEVCSETPQAAKQWPPSCFVVSNPPHRIGQKERVTQFFLYRAESQYSILWDCSRNGLIFQPPQPQKQKHIIEVPKGYHRMKLTCNVSRNGGTYTIIGVASKWRMFLAVVTFDVTDNFTQGAMKDCRGYQWTVSIPITDIWFMREEDHSNRVLVQQSRFGLEIPVDIDIHEKTKEAQFILVKPDSRNPFEKTSVPLDPLT